MTPLAERPALIDEYAELDRQYRLWQVNEKRYEHLKKTIKAFADDDKATPEAEPTYRGVKYQIALTACENESHIDLAKTLEAVGVKKFLSIVEASVTKLKAVCPKAEKLGLFHLERTGGRKIKSVVALEKAA